MSKFIEVVPQTDDRSCGWCALKSVYQVLDINCSHLRERLGVDSVLPIRSPVLSLIENTLIRKIPAFGELRGTWPSTLQRVMREDGLDTLVTSSGVDFLKRLKKSGRPGLILNMHGAHWCAVQWDTETANNEDALWIANSLKETIHKISVSDFRDEFVAGLVITDIGQPADYDVDICKELDTLVGSGFGIVRHFLSLKLPFLK